MKHEKCKNCPAVRNIGTEIEATGNHTYGEENWTAPVLCDCGNDGSIGYYTCTGCGQRFDSEGNLLSDEDIIVPATGEHTYEDEWTYFSADQHVRYCTVCGAPEYEGHDVIVRGGGDEGYTGDEFCSVCGQRLREGEIIPATGNHTEGDLVAENVVEASCTEDGSYEVVTYCTVCGKELHRVPKTQKAFGHMTELVNAKEATATEDGYTGDEVCTLCGKTIKTGTVVPATGTPDTPTTPAGGCPLCGENHDGHPGIKAVHYVMYWLIWAFRDWLPGFFKK